MAPLAIAPDLPPMRVGVAFRALRWKAQERPIGVLHLGFAQNVEVKVIKRVTGPALNLAMLADQRIPGLRVIEARLPVGPVDEFEVAPDVLAVACGAIAFLLARFDDSAVISAPRYDPAPDLLVAVRADENRLTGSKHMARVALQGAVKLSMSPGQRPRRKLGVRLLRH